MSAVAGFVGVLNRLAMRKLPAWMVTKSVNVPPVSTPMRIAILLVQTLLSAL
jgi:hypothetical protein